MMTMTAMKTSNGYWAIHNPRSGCWLSRGVTGIDIWTTTARHALTYGDRKVALKEAQKRQHEYPFVVVCPRPGALKAARRPHPEEDNDD